MDDPLFAWGNEFVRNTDPKTSFNAQARLDIKGDSKLALQYFRIADLDCEDGMTRVEFEQYVETLLLEEGKDYEHAHRRAESLRRRLTGLREKGLLEYRLGEPDKKGKRHFRERDGQYILFVVIVSHLTKNNSHLG
jgi:hypothetical protein